MTNANRIAMTVAGCALAAVVGIRTAQSQIAGCNLTTVTAAPGGTTAVCASPA